jgi:hypothetical protein
MYYQPLSQIRREFISADILDQNLYCTIGEVSVLSRPAWCTVIALILFIECEVYAVS